MLYLHCFPICMTDQSHHSFLPNILFPYRVATNKIPPFHPVLSHSLNICYYSYCHTFSLRPPHSPPTSPPFTLHFTFILSLSVFHHPSSPYNQTTSTLYSPTYPQSHHTAYADPHLSFSAKQNIPGISCLFTLDKI